MREEGNSIRQMQLASPPDLWGRRRVRCAPRKRRLVHDPKVFSLTPGRMALLRPKPGRSVGLREALHSEMSPLSPIGSLLEISGGLGVQGCLPTLVGCFGGSKESNPVPPAPTSAEK